MIIKFQNEDKIISKFATIVDKIVCYLLKHFANFVQGNFFGNPNHKLFLNIPLNLNFKFNVFNTIIKNFYKLMFFFE